jgi:acetylornithine deacetylase
MRVDVTDGLARLVSIDSVNPALVPGGAGESEIARFVATWAERAGLNAEILEATPGRPSVVVRATGRGGGRMLMLCAHLDTVNVEEMNDPHTPRVDGDRMYGRGAYDMKAGLASALIACREAAELGLAGDVVVGAVASVVGAPPPVEGASYWADAAFLSAAGIPTVMFGSSGAGAHEPEEWVSLSDTADVVRVLVDVARRVCA